jgi:hypothetical protein
VGGGGAGHTTDAIGYLADGAVQSRAESELWGWVVVVMVVVEKSRAEWCCGRVAAPERVVLFLWIMLGLLASPL